MKEDKIYHGALVLEGGGNRGVFTAGVLDVFMEENLWLNYVVGVSAGACNGVDYASRQIGRTRDCMINEDPAYKSVSLSKMIKNRTLFDMEMLFEDFPRKIYPFDFERFFEGDVFCENVVTDCMSGKAAYLTEYKDKDRLLKIIRASSSLPGFAPFVSIDNQLYCDGGVADPIPVQRAIDKGYKKQVIVLTREDGYQKKKSFTKYLMAESYHRKYPRLYAAICRQHEIYNKTLDKIKRWEEEEKIIVLRPRKELLDRSGSDISLLKAFYEQGKEVAYQYLDKIRTYLAE